MANMIKAGGELIKGEDTLGSPFYLEISSHLAILGLEIGLTLSTHPYMMPPAIT